MGRCTGLINQCKFGLDNLLAGIYTPATELELIKFWTLPLGDLVWHLSIQMNDGDLAAYINIFEIRRGKHRRLINFTVYALVYPSIAINLVTLDNLSNWFESV